MLQNENVERVTSYKYLGVTIRYRKAGLEQKHPTPREERAAETLLYANSKKLQSGQDNSTTFPPCACRNCTDILHRLLVQSADNKRQNEAAASDFPILKNRWD